MIIKPPPTLPACHAPSCAGKHCMGGPLKAFRFASSQPGPRPNALGKRWVPAVR